MDEQSWESKEDKLIGKGIDESEVGELLPERG